MEPVRILITLDFPPKEGGISTWAYQMAKNFAQAGERTVVFCRDNVLGPKPFYAPEPFTIEPMHGWNWPAMRNFYMVYYTGKILFKYGSTVVVYALHWKLSVGPSIWAKIFPIKVVTVAHGWEITKRVKGFWKSIVMKWAFNNVHRIIAVSNFTAHQIQQKTGVKSHKIEVVHNGVDQERFYPKEPSQCLREKLGLNDKKVILTLARIVHRKGQDKVIEALPYVLQKVPEAVYIVAGRGRYKAYLEKLASDLGIRDKVIFAGYVPDELVTDYYNLCDLYAMPCREVIEEGNVEGFGITFLEAGACGKPVLGGLSGGVEDAVIHGETGFLADPLDVEQIAKYLTLLLVDRDLALRLGGNARRRVENGFSWFDVAERILAIRL